MHQNRAYMNLLAPSFDLDRMKAALAHPDRTIRIPEGVSRDALRAFIIESNKTKKIDIIHQ